MQNKRSSISRKLLAFVLAVVLAAQSISFSLAGYDGAFVLCVMTPSETIVEPIRIPYAQGQTAAEAIDAAGITLTYEDGILQAVNGVYAAYSICMDDGGFDLSREAAGVTAVCIADRTSDQQPMIALLRAMGVYLENNANVQNYKPASDAYTDALRVLKSDDAEHE